MLARQVVYVKEGVAVWPSKNQRIMGRLSLVKQHCVMFLAWLPYSAQQNSSSSINNEPGHSCSEPHAGDVVGETAACLSIDQSMFMQPGQSMLMQSTAEPAHTSGACVTAVPHVAGMAPPVLQHHSWDSTTTAVCNGSQLDPDSEAFQRLNPANPAATSSSPDSKPQQQQQSAQHAGDHTMYAIHPIPLSEIKAIRRHTPPLGWHYIVMVLVSGLTLPPLFFHQGGVRQLLRVLKQYAHLVKSCEDANTYLVNDIADPLQRSLTSLDLSDILLGAPAPGSSVAPAPVDIATLNGGWLDSPVVSELAWRGIGDRLGETLCRVTNFARESASSIMSAAADAWQQDGDGVMEGSLMHYLGHAVSHANGSSSFGDAVAAVANGSSIPRPVLSSTAHGASCSSDLVAAAGSAAAVQNGVKATPGMSLCAANGGTATLCAGHFERQLELEADSLLGSFELVDCVVEDQVDQARRRVRPPPLSLEEFGTYFNAEGVLVDEAGFRGRVFYSGGGWLLLLLYAGAICTLKP